MTIKGHVRACPQIKDASKRTDGTTKRNAKALVLKLRMRAEMTTKGHVLTSSQIKEASKQLDVTSKRIAKALVLKYGSEQT